MTKVMLVEDDQTMLSLLSTLMDFEGYQAVTIKKFGNVIAEIKQEKPQLVLMDVHLDQVDGIKLLSEIRKDSQLKNLKVIMSSGMDYKDQCIRTGADDFILKPYMPDELIDRVKKLIQK